MQKSTIIVLVAMAVGIAFLASLGTWQLKRLVWKEELISQIKSRASSQPLDLAAIEKQWQKDPDVDYMPVTLSGTFEHQLEMYYYTTWKGRAGWNVITPLRMSDGRYALLNRGFVPLEFRDPEKRKIGLIADVVQITGLSRNPIFEKPNSLMPDNQLDTREFYWKSQSQLASLIGDKANIYVLPFTIDAGANTSNFKYPKGGTTRMVFANSHLQYAVTWYGLALALLGVGSVFLYGRRKQAA